jgi:hypothetical protein
LRVGIIVEGDGEFGGLPKLWPRVQGSHRIVRTLKSNFAPDGPTGHIAMEAAKTARILVTERVDRIVLLLDMEARAGCPGLLAEELAAEVQKRLGDSCPIAGVGVVVKMRAFENWLVADPQAIRALPGLFDKASAATGRVSPDKADRVDAIKLLKNCMRAGRTYHKRRCAEEICSRLDPLRAASNSRSFRKLLRELGVPKYRNQSRTP